MPGRPVKVLNLVCIYGWCDTRCSSVQELSVTHVDASKGMVTWAKENAAASGLAEAPIRWLVDDCVKFVEREIRRGNKYDGIIMDPPSYGRGPKGEILEDRRKNSSVCTIMYSDIIAMTRLSSLSIHIQQVFSRRFFHYMIEYRTCEKSRWKS